MAMQVPIEPFREGTVLLGKYRVERLLGRGGMGMVVSALNLDLDQRVALKFVNAESAHRHALVERFVREARAASKLRSEHVAKVMDVGKLETGLPYMVMELLEGRDLRDLVTDDGPVPVPTAVDFVLQAIDVVAEAHQLGIVHRDLKPANLFLATRADGERIIKLLDFGISKVQGAFDESGDRVALATLTATSAFLGSPAYASPEQCRSPKDVDLRTDIWALGAILYELITGRRPFDAPSQAELLAAVFMLEPMPVRVAMPQVPVALEAAIFRCLRKNPAERFSTVAELAMAIAPFGSGHWNRCVDRAVRLVGHPSPAAPGAQTYAASAITGPGDKRISAKVVVAILVGVLAALSLAAGALLRVTRKHEPQVTRDVGPPVATPSASVAMSASAAPEPTPSASAAPSASAPVETKASETKPPETKPEPKPAPRPAPRDRKKSLLETRQ